MNQFRRRTSYQFGHLQLEPRKRGPDVWVYRYLKIENGRKSRPKFKIGTVEKLPTELDAQRACEALRMQINAECAVQTDYTVRGLVDRYIEEILKPCLEVSIGQEQGDSAFMSYHCAKSYRSALEKYVLPRWETYRLVEFTRAATRALVERWFRELLRSAENPKGLAPKTVRSIYGVMRIAFKFSVKWGYLELNPLSDKRVELPRGSTKRLKKAPQLTPAQFFYLLTLFTSREKLAVAFAGWLGPRISEAFGLQWGDIDFDRAVCDFHSRIRARSHHSTEDRGFSHRHAHPGRGCPTPAGLAFEHSIQSTFGLGVRLGVHQGAPSNLACSTDEGAYPAGRCRGWFSKDQLAQLPAHGECLGQRGRS
jgi:hypothetical protein